MQTQPDVVIIGAGAAGVGAGLELAQRGVSFAIFEASDRVGGRAFTDAGSLAVPWDQGCHWLHCADQNPLVEWADRLGARYLRQDHDAKVLTYWSDGRFVDDTSLSAAEQAFDTAFATVDTAGRAGRDVPLSDFLQPQDPWYPNIYCLLGLLAGDDPERISTMGYADYADTEANWPVASGYGDLITRMADDLPIRLGVSVTAIQQRPEGVTLTTSDGQITTKGVIVTPSTSVLGSGAIEFGPGPAADLLTLIADVPCGVYEKVAFAMHRLPAELQGKLYGMITPAGEPAMNFQIIAGDMPLIVVHMAGDMVRSMLTKGADELRTFARDRLVLAFGEGILDMIDSVAVTDWTNNPWVRGSYSHAIPGAAARRHQMIATDTGNVAFAGEAFSLRWQATAHGAYQSGRDVATRLLAHI